MIVTRLNPDGSVIDFMDWLGNDPLPDNTRPATAAEIAALAPPAPVALVDKLVIVDRLIAANLINQAIAAMAANPVTKIRFDAATQIDPLDPAVLAFLAAIGADPSVILAPTPQP